MTRLPRAHLLALVALAAVACGPPEITVVPAPVKANPESVEFGELAIGGRLTQVIELSNKGAAAVTLVDPVTRDGSPAFTLVDVLTTDCKGEPRTVPDLRVLKNEECARFTVAFAPKETKDFEDSIVIAFLNDEYGAFELPISGTGVTPTMQVCVLLPNGELDDSQCSKAASGFVPVLDFGGVSFDETSTRKVRVRNIGSVSFQLAKVELSGSNAAEFKRLGDEPLPALGGQSQVDFEVEFAPRNAGDLNAYLQVSPADEGQSISLIVKGVGLGPEICVLPVEGLSFGDVPVGESRLQTLAISNCGPVRYQVVALTLEGDDGAFHVAEGDVPAMPHNFGQGLEIRLHVTVTPKSVKTLAARVHVRTEREGVLFKEFDVPILAKGVAPDCSHRLPVANAGPDVTVEPLREVTLDGSLSRAGFGNIRYAWSIAAQPSGAAADFGPVSSATPVLSTTLPGEYILELRVSDEYGCESAVDTVVVHAVPRSRLFIQLTWEEEHSDLDLHFVGPGGAYGTPPGDASWRNPTPDWGAGGVSDADEDSDNDPRFSSDVPWGLGPESVLVPRLEDGKYDVWVTDACDRPFVDGRYDAPRGAATARIRVWMNGALITEATQQLRSGDRWHATVLDVSARGAAVTATAVEDAVDTTALDVCPSPVQ